MDNKRPLNEHLREDSDTGCVETTTVTKQAQALSARLRDGDPEAFRTVYMQWYEPVSHVLTGILRNTHDAQDLAQDVFSALWTQRERIIPEKDIRSLIFTLARHLASKHIRRNRIQSNYFAGADRSEQGADSTAELIDARELELLTQYIVQKMPRQRREIYLMNLNEGLSPAEIAVRLGITPKKVRDHIYEARREIKEAISFATLLMMLMM